MILLTAAAAAAEPVDSRADLVDRLLDRIVAGEQDFLSRMRAYQPFIEIYLQSADDVLGALRGDQYAMGRIGLDRHAVGWTPFAESDGFVGRNKMDESSLEQIAALPLGSRIRLDPWTDEISLLTVKPTEIRTADDKLPFKVTPFLINLKRLGEQE